LGMFCSTTLHFSLFASIPSRSGCSCDGYYILHLPRQAMVRSPLGWAPGLLYTQHCTSAGVLLFPSTPLSGVLDFSLLTNFPRLLSSWCALALCGHDTRELPSYQNPRYSTSRLSPLPRLILLLLPSTFRAFYNIDADVSRHPDKSSRLSQANDRQ
jgi:hypothetical protein